MKAPMTKRNRAEFNEWLVNREETPIVVGGKKYSALDLLTDREPLIYDVVYERWAARDKGDVEAHS